MNTAFNAEETLAGLTQFSRYGSRDIQTQSQDFDGSNSVAFPENPFNESLNPSNNLPMSPEAYDRSNYEVCAEGTVTYVCYYYRDAPQVFQQHSTASRTRQHLLQMGLVMGTPLATSLIAGVVLAGLSSPPSTSAQTQPQEVKKVSSSRIVQPTPAAPDRLGQPETTWRPVASLSGSTQLNSSPARSLQAAKSSSLPAASVALSIAPSTAQDAQAVQDAQTVQDAQPAQAVQPEEARVAETDRLPQNVDSSSLASESPDAASTRADQIAANLNAAIAESVPSNSLDKSPEMRSLELDPSATDGYPVSSAVSASALTASAFITSNLDHGQPASAVLPEQSPNVFSKIPLKLQSSKTFLSQLNQSSASKAALDKTVK